MGHKIAEFQWKGINRFGQKQFGKRLAKNRSDLEYELLEKGYKSVHIRRNFSLAQKPKQENITQFISQLALLLNASIPLNQCLTMILENCSNRYLYVWIEHLISQLKSGYSFSSALEKSHSYFQPQEIQLIKIGEQSGNLATLLSNIAQARNKSEKLAKKVKKILFYPVVILTISLTLSLLLLLFIVPQFAELYGENAQSLPLITAILFDISNFLQKEFYFLLYFIFILALILFFISKKSNLLNRFKMWILTKLPVFKTIIHQSRIIFFSQNLSLMLKSHIRLETALQTFITTKPLDPILQQEILFMLTLLKQGYPFSVGLNPNIFDNQTIQMIAIGEKSAELDAMLDYIADIYQQKLDYQIDILAQLLEPLLMIIMGIIVGTILIGLYLPIFDMGTMV